MSGAAPARAGDFQKNAGANSHLPNDLLQIEPVIAGGGGGGRADDDRETSAAGTLARLQIPHNARLIAKICSGASNPGPASNGSGIAPNAFLSGGLQAIGEVQTHDDRRNHLQSCGFRGQTLFPVT
jgi:hypothetical protein